MSEDRELFGQSETTSGRAVAYQVLARRARPQAFADVVGQEHVTQTLTNALATGRLAHAFVFSGMRGVGKTTTARILAKALNCAEGPTATPCNRCSSCVEITEGRSLDVLEVDAASQTGIDATRELLETVKYQPASARFRVYIIDEAHGLSKQAVDAFLKTLEEPPAHAKFILATTAVHKLPSTILSRCQRFDFRSVAGDTVVKTLDAIVRKEGKQADEDALRAIARESGGSMRDATSLLDQVLAFASGTVDLAAVNAALGLPDEIAVREILGAVVARDPGRALEVIGRVCAQGVDLARFGQALLERLRNATVLAVAGPQALADLAASEIEDLAASQRDVPPADLQRWFRILLEALDEVSRSPYPRLVLEMAIVQMATLAPLVPLDQLVARLEALERGGGGDAGRGARFARPAPS
ncbi:DNA polymerase III subunit gamma/tau, partial [Candidatus Binatia bacterium]|nr:DNA polymerase III subunit gamma/tau [Candidatus Binatia bacterium]